MPIPVDCAHLARAAPARPLEGSPDERVEGHLTRPRPGTAGCQVGRMAQEPQVVEDPDLIALVAGAFDTLDARWTQADAGAVAAASGRRAPCRATSR